ncbi:MAG: M48 family metalloprotease [Candidatus Omnitrophica bacterium]|nr:M48 family metalloprotease [Candidatus Omnitrophota bacterium]MBU1996084.1 M48 family metalloprotease [Candidatus Omnitrophota bacterium]MBU4333441.1 M48 family metalloprotease [Candidatus Omnitrophota bacterium]
MRNCPVCSGHELKPVYTKQGVEIDICTSCEGIWLDKSEIYYFVKDSNLVYEALCAAIKNRKATTRKSPVTGEEMVELPLFNDSVMIDYCPKTGGIWLDKGEITKFPSNQAAIDVDKGFFKQEVQQAPEHSAQQGQEIKPSPSRSVVAHAAGLLTLPNLAFSSTMVLAGMYSLLTLGLIFAVQFAGVAPGMALTVGIIIAALQFLFGPFLMDLSLNWIYKFDWVKPENLPVHLNDFISKISQENSIQYPRIGLINDGGPNAFTYGHHPNNARIVLTTGLLELLNEKEVEAVVAHEVGHVVHWDMLVMTLAQLVPLIFYYIYRTLIRMRSRGRDKSAPARYAIAIGAYILYIISEYIVLWFSRIREYYADRFAGQTTGAPGELASALVKIGYGLAGREPSEKKDKDSNRSAAMKGIEPLGIFNAKHGSTLALASGVSSKSMGGEIDKDTLRDVAKWDLWNPWASFYEIHSTHPLIAKRIRMLSNLSVVMGKEPYIEFDERKPESYWDEFFVDLTIQSLPWIAVLGWGIVNVFGFLTNAFATGSWTSMSAFTGPNFGLLVLLFGVGYLIRTIFAYPDDQFAPMNIKALLKKIKVSAIRPVPCKITGKIIGRGVPGLIWSEDFILQDETGIIFMDYAQPLGFINFLFGLLRAKQYHNQEAEVIGWYRRAPVPYIEIKQIKTEGASSSCYVYTAKLIWSIILIVAGIFLFFV